MRKYQDLRNCYHYYYDSDTISFLMPYLLPALSPVVAPVGFYLLILMKRPNELQLTDKEIKIRNINSLLKII